MKDMGGEKTDGTKESVKDYRKAHGGSELVDYIGVHNKLSRILEVAEDLVVALITLTLLVLALLFLWRVWVEVVTLDDLQEGVSNILYVFITVELFRLSLHYLRYHRVALDVLVEVGITAIIQKMILIGVDRFSVQQLIGISLILLALGALLWVQARKRSYSADLIEETSRGEVAAGSKSQEQHRKR